MSHVTDMKLKIMDLDAAEEAAKEAGLVLMRGQTTFKWFGRFVNDSNTYGEFDPNDFGKCEHAMRRVDHHAGDYEIGLAARKDGGKGWMVGIDTWGSGSKLVAPLAVFRREYAAIVATKKARQALRGARVMREALPGNRIRLRVVER